MLNFAEIAKAIKFNQSKQILEPGKEQEKYQNEPEVAQHQGLGMPPDQSADYAVLKRNLNGHGCT